MAFDRTSPNFGLQFATPPKFCLEGFNRIYLGLDIPAEMEAPLYAAFERGHRSGDPRLQLQLLTEVLNGVSWSWPWLNACADELAAAGLMSLTWRRFGIGHPTDWRKCAIPSLIELLSFTLSKSAFTVFNWSQMTHPDVLLVSKPTVILAGGQCDASLYMVNKYRCQIEALDGTVLPPFFPMDLSLLTSIWPRRARLGLPNSG